MKNKLEHEEKLYKKALEFGCKLAEMQGYKISDKNQSKPVIAKALYIFLVNVRLIAPLPVDKTDGPNIKRRLAIWMKGNLEQAKKQA